MKWAGWVIALTMCVFASIAGAQDDVIFVEHGSEQAPEVVEEPAPIPPPPQVGLAPTQPERTVGYGAPAQAPRLRPPKTGLIGWFVLAGGYVFSALVGALIWTEATTTPGTTCANCDEVGPRMVIPLIGPWLALPYSDGADGKVISAVFGVIQSVGLLWGIVGTIFYRRWEPPNAQVRLEPNSLTVRW